jgi:hypothetical protein
MFLNLNWGSEEGVEEPGVAVKEEVARIAPAASCPFCMATDLTGDTVDSYPLAELEVDPDPVNADANLEASVPPPE